MFTGKIGRVHKTVEKTTAIPELFQPFHFRMLTNWTNWLFLSWFDWIMTGFMVEEEILFWSRWKSMLNDNHWEWNRWSLRFIDALNRKNVPLVWQFHATDVFPAPIRIRKFSINSTNRHPAVCSVHSETIFVGHNFYDKFKCLSPWVRVNTIASFECCCESVSTKLFGWFALDRNCIFSVYLEFAAVCMLDFQPFGRNFQLIDCENCLQQCCMAYLKLISWNIFGTACKARNSTLDQVFYAFRSFVHNNSVLLSLNAICDVIHEISHKKIALKII